MKSLMPNQERFAHIESMQVKRSSFDRSSGLKTTLDAGKLYPIYIEEALPGDTFNVSPTVFGRIATPLKPIMDNIFIDVHFFSCPLRLVWDNFKKFMGEQIDPDDSVNYLIPTMSPPQDTGYDELSIYDYMGLPTKNWNYEHSSLFLRAYNLIWNEWYRDQNLQDSVLVNKGDSGDTPFNYQILPRNKRKDYFTSALPWAQKAEPVSIPLTGNAPVYGLDVKTETGFSTGHLWQGAGTRPDFSTFSWTSSMAQNPSSTFTDKTAFFPLGEQTDNTGRIGLGTKSDYENALGNEEPPYADLSDLTAVTINQLREAATLQQFYERDARGGTRYTETIKSHFNVTSPDARLQRPEYLGGSSSPLTMQEVDQTSASADGATPQGNLAAKGTVQMSSRGFTKTFTEHEIIIGLLSVRADLNYQQGLHRMWSRKTRFDFYWPSFAHLGEQAIPVKEIWTDSNDADINEETFGYQERYAEYRYKPSMITGLFRSNAAQSLDLWHLAQEFETKPTLSNDFIVENPPINRIVAVPSEPQFIIDIYFKEITARPMPTYATPGIGKI